MDPRLLLIAGASALVLATAAGLYVKGRHDGAHHEQVAEAGRLKVAQANVARHEAAAAEITEKLAVKASKAALEIRWRTQTLVEKVPVYVTAEADRDCPVPVGFVRLHNAAASGGPASLPVTPGGPVDTDSGVPLSAVAATVVANYGTAFGWRNEAVAWRDWYAQQSAAWK